MGFKANLTSQVFTTQWKSCTSKAHLWILSHLGDFLGGSKPLTHGDAARPHSILPLTKGQWLTFSFFNGIIPPPPKKKMFLHFIILKKKMCTLCACLLHNNSQKHKNRSSVVIRADLLCHQMNAFSGAGATIVASQQEGQGLILPFLCRVFARCPHLPMPVSLFCK